MKTAITVVAQTYSTNPCIHGVSIDEPLNIDFPYSQPEKSIEENIGSFSFDQSFDLTLGTHTLYYANTASDKWQATVVINDNDATMGGTALTQIVTVGNPLILTFNVIDHPVYPVFTYHFVGGETYYSLEEQALVQALSCLYPLNPFSIYIDPSKTGHIMYPMLETQLYTYQGYTANYMHTGEAGLGSRGHLWYGVLPDKVFGVVPFELSALGKVATNIGTFEVGISVPPPFLVCNGQPISGQFNFYCGHVREGADLRNLTWDNDLVIDAQALQTYCQEQLCYTGSQQPADYSSAVMSAKLVSFTPYAPILVPGRLTICRITLNMTRGTAGIPYARIKESPAYWVGREGTAILGILGGSSTTMDTMLEVVLTSQMVSQGYFTVEYGHVIPVSGSSVFMLAQTVKDGELQVPLQYTLASIRKLSVKATNPPVAAKIRRLDVKSTVPPVLAAIRRIDVKSTAAAVAAAIRRLDIKTSSGPPPPPPSEYATLMGTVLNFMGQPVANCQVSLIGGASASTTTADDGTFEIDNIPVGTYTLIATPTNLFDKLLLKGTSMPIDLTLPTGYSQDVTLNLNTLNLAVGGAALFTGIGVAAYETSKPKTYGGYKWSW